MPGEKQDTSSEMGSFPNLSHSGALHSWCGLAVPKPVVGSVLLIELPSGQGIRDSLLVPTWQFLSSAEACFWVAF